MHIIAATIIHIYIYAMKKAADWRFIWIHKEKTTKRVDFISYNENKKEATFLRRPERSELNADINEALIVEYYSRV